MYIPPSFREERVEVLHALMKEHGFATLVTRCEGELFASHLPLLLDAERGLLGTLRGHMARANPQWQGFSEDEEALVIFHGPHAYVSPSWYATHPSVPTWNFVAIHAYGVPRIVEAAALREILQGSVEQYEGSRPDAWSMDRLPEEYLRGMVNGIVGFEISISRLEGKRKLSQNRPPADRAWVIRALEAEGDGVSHAVAQMMRETAP